MGDKSEILESLSAMSTGTLLALILAAQVYFQYDNDRQWNERMAAVFERQAAAAEQMVALSERNGKLLMAIINKQAADDVE